MIQRLFVNGCSYMHLYHQGGGTADLAKKLEISKSLSEAKSGACNGRIIRTTLRDMYASQVPTLYLLGMTFVHRYELTLLQDPTEDGHWVSFNPWMPSWPNGPPTNWQKNLTMTELNNFGKLYTKMIYGKDLLEDLMYRLRCLIDTAKQQSHKILIFNTAEHGVDKWITDSKFDLFKNNVHIIGGFRWKSIPWQFEQGASYLPQDEQFPANCRHVRPGDHHWLNQFLLDYINEHKILQ